MVKNWKRRVALAVVPTWRAIGRWRTAAMGPQIAHWCRLASPWAMRVALSVVYFWFGFVKLLGLSEATPLAHALTEQTVGARYFDTLFTALAVIECAIGVVVMFPRLRNVALPAIAVHMGIVCAPLVLVPQHAWQSFLVPTLEGQYIIKNVLVVAAVLALGAGAQSRVDHAAARAEVAPPVLRGSWLDRVALAVSLAGVTIAAIALWSTVHDDARPASASSPGVTTTVVVAPPGEAAEPAASSTTASPAPAPLDPLALRYSGGVMTLTGSVGTEAEHSLVVAEAQELLAVSSIDDQLVVGAGAPVPRLAVSVPIEEVFADDGTTIRLDFSPSIVRVATEAQLHGHVVIDVTVATQAQAAAVHQILVAQGVASERIVLHATDGTDGGRFVTIAFDGLI